MSQGFRITYISAKLTSISTENLLLILSPSLSQHKQPQFHPQPNPSRQWLKWESVPWATYCRGYHGNGRCRNLSCHPPNERLQWWQTQANSLWKWVFIPDMPHLLLPALASSRLYTSPATWQSRHWQILWSKDSWFVWKEITYIFIALRPEGACGEGKKSLK